MDEAEILAELKAALNNRAHPQWRALLEPLLPDVATHLGATNTPREEFAPPLPEVFRAFSPPPARVRWVLLGQGPYPGGEAHGLAFSDGRANPDEIPHSLRAVFREIAAEQPSANLTSPNLENWRFQGALLLNAALTTRLGGIHAHARAWRELVKVALRAVAATAPSAVVFAWGEEARRRALEEFPPERVRESTHPAAERHGFVFRADFAVPPLRGVPWDWATVQDVLFYTDGARPGMNQRGAPGHAGAGIVWCAWPRVAAAGVEIRARWAIAVPGEQTNQRAELHAICEALRLVLTMVVRCVLVRSDSQYAIRVTTGEWRARANPDLAERARRLHDRVARACAARGGALTFEHVRGHRGEPGNEAADRAASLAAAKPVECPRAGWSTRIE